MNQKLIRNFSIIAHIDHGKSTLADRLLEATGALSERERSDQFLDKMELERERGITIKAQAVRLNYTANDGETYVLNLIDTPGHVDFSYEVSRSLAACEGATLVVDASQGVEAQTLANVYLAIDEDLEVFPVLNKIDLPSAEPERICEEIEEIIGLDTSDAVFTSAKDGKGIDEFLEAIVKKIPHPKGDYEAPLKALIFDSWYDSYQGVVSLVRIVDGRVKKGDRIRLMANGHTYEALKVGVFSPHPVAVAELGAGEVGFVVAGIKDLNDAKVGDTITHDARRTANPLPGFKDVKPMVFSGLYPIDNGDYEMLRDAMEKLRLNDSSFSFDPETSIALGFGFRCGFLGLLHMEIIQERLEREFGVDLITTAPTVVYRVTTTKGETFNVDSANKLPEVQFIEKVEEPFILASVHVPNEFVGAVLALCEEKRGMQREIKYLTANRVMVIYELPLNEIVLDFFDRLKSITRGYASLDYEHLDYRESSLVRLNIMINGEVVDALSLIVHRDKAQFRGRDLAAKMKEFIPRQQFEVAIQAAIGNKVIARETVKALRKDVTAKCYGGDISRKRKLLEKQKEGKKRMKQVGSVELPQEAFLAILKVKEKKMIFKRKPADGVDLSVKKPWWKEYGEALLVAAILAMVIRTFVVQAFKIPSGSMEDTLLIGDHLLVNKFLYGVPVPFTDQHIFAIRNPSRGDVIVFEFPEDKDKSYFDRRDFIKRVVGTPGDIIEVRSKQVFVNGEHYALEQEVHKERNIVGPQYGPRDNMSPTQVPEGHYFVMGDNRDRSFDSRFWGFVPEDNIKGLAFIKYWSWNSDSNLPRWERIGRTIE